MDDSQSVGTQYGRLDGGPLLPPEVPIWHATEPIEAGEMVMVEFGSGEVRRQTLAEFVSARLDETTALAVLVRSDIEEESVEDETSEGVRTLADFVVADCESKRRIVELHSQDEHDCVEMHRGAYPADWPVEAAWGKAGEPWAHPSLEHHVGPCPTLLALAQPYAAHPDFREEWRL